jgi:uncharacterized protein (DUF1015 family)
MPIFRPFKAFRPRPELAKQIAALPYDVMNSGEARTEVAKNPLSYLHVGKPEVDLDSEVSVYDKSVYEKGRDNLQNYIKNNQLVQDEKESMYIYGQTMDGRTQYGFVGCASVEDYENDKIKKHEFTRPIKEEDRCNHVRVTNAHCGPIFLTFRDDEEINNKIKEIISGKPDNDHVSDDGIRHTTWVISDDDLINYLRNKFSSMDAFYVADGHHRSAAAAIVGRERADANPHHDGAEEYNFFLAVLFPASQLYIMDYNRVVKDLNGNSLEEFFDRIKSNFKISEVESKYKPENKGDYGLYIEKKWYKLSASQELINNPDPVEKLDVAILQKYILNEILGIEDPRTSNRIDFVGGIRGLSELERRVDSGEMKLAISMYPTSIDELMDIADSGKVMPPKSTWFEPKLRDGLFTHFLD